MNLLMKPLTVSRLANWLEKTFCHHIDVFCEEEVPEYVQQDCGVENGGIVAIGLILSSTYVGEDGNDTEKRTNLESSTWWEDAINASPQGAWVVLQTRGSKAAGTPVEEEGFGLNSVERTGDDQEIVFEALGFLDNRDFWSGVNKRRGWGFVTISKGTSGSLIGTYFEDTSIYADVVIDQSIKSRIRISGSAKLSTDMTPGLPFTAPSAIFNP